MDIDDIIVSTRADTAPDIIFIQFSQATNTGAKKKTNFLLSHLFVCVLVPVLHTNNQFRPLAFRTNVFYIFISMFLRSHSVLCNCYCPSCTLLLSCIFVQYTRTIVIWMGIEINYIKYIIYIHIHINICM